MKRSYLLLGLFLPLFAFTPLAQATLAPGYNYEQVDWRALSYACPDGTARMSWNTANYEWLVWLHVNDPAFGEVQLVYSTKPVSNYTAKWDGAPFSYHVIQQIDDTEMNNPAWDIFYANSTNTVYVVWAKSWPDWDGYFWMGTCNETSRTIDWFGSPVIFFNGTSNINHPEWNDVTVSNDHAYVAYHLGDDLYITKNENTASGWSTASGYPKLLKEGDSDHLLSMPTVVNLGSDDVAVIYNENYYPMSEQPLWYRRCTSDALGDETSISDQSDMYFSTVNMGTTAYISFWNKTSAQSFFTTLTAAGLGSFETISSDNRAHVSTLSYDYYDSKFYLFGEYSSEVGMWTRSGGVWSNVTSLGTDDGGIFGEYVCSKEFAWGGAKVGFFWARVSNDTSWVWDNSLRAMWAGGASIVGAPTVTVPAAGAIASPGGTMTVTWTIPSGNQTAYQIQIGNSDFTNITSDTNKVVSASKTVTVTAPATAGSYYLRVYYWDGTDTQSSASTARQFYVDRLEVYEMGAAETSVIVGTEQMVWAKARREALRTPLGSGVSFVSASVTFQWNTLSLQFEAHPSLDAPGTLTFSSVSSVSAPAIGLTSGRVTATPISINWHTQGGGGQSGGGVYTGGDPQQGSSTGGSMGGVAGVKLGSLDAVAKQANPASAELPVTWYGVPDILCVSLDFGEYVKWITVNDTFPARLDGHQSGTIPIEITPPADAKEGKYTIPVEGVFTASGYTSMRSINYIYLTVEKGVAPYEDPTKGSPIPNVIGVLIGGAFLIALIVAFRRR